MMNLVNQESGALSAGVHVPRVSSHPSVPTLPLTSSIASPSRDGPPPSNINLRSDYGKRRYRSGTHNPVSSGQNSGISARVSSGAKWFYWIAGLSLINSVIALFGGNLHFVVGLGITSVVDVIAKQTGSAGSVLDLIINGFVAGVFVLFGSFALKGQKWAFLTGMALYALDGLLLLTVMDIFGVAFHAYALFAIYRGFAAVNQVQAAAPANMMAGGSIDPR